MISYEHYFSNILYLFMTTGVFFNELKEQILKKLQRKPIRKIDKFIWDPDDFEHHKFFIYSSVSKNFL